ncbi:hypothetical protein SAMN06298216_2446 [Spirosomataceae bacterium TFI 002]|nr:hypothetical protein SAMN06298216_2446 [Spirosomataceae bacterium TFI 002]
MKKLFCLLILLSPLFSIAQDLKPRKEFALPLNPWTMLGQSFYVQYEQYTKPQQSFTLMAGYKGTDFFNFYFNRGNYNGHRIAYGQRFYAKPQDRWMNLYAEGKIMLEHGKLTLPSIFNVTDSLETRGFTITPELLVGFKATILQRVVMSFNMGIRYRFNNLNTQKLTFNPEYWKYDDWDNDNLDPAKNRAYITNFNKGLSPSINLNFGFLLR